MAEIVTHGGDKLFVAVAAGSDSDSDSNNSRQLSSSSSQVWIWVCVWTWVFWRWIADFLKMDCRVCVCILTDVWVCVCCFCIWLTRKISCWVCVCCFCVWLNRKICCWVCVCVSGFVIFGFNFVLLDLGLCSCSRHSSISINVIFFNLNADVESHVIYVALF